MTTQEEQPDRPARWAARLAGIIHAEGYPGGDRAALKRMGIRGQTPLAFYRLIYKKVSIAQWQLNDADQMEKWRTLVSGIAMQHGNSHDVSFSLGKALASIDFSEIRLESLLSARGRTFNTLVLRLCRRLAAQRQKCDWFQIAELLFESGKAQQRIRDRIASDFYRSKRAVDRAA